jgi:hypothetical protein
MPESTTFSEFVSSLPDNDVATAELHRLADYSEDELATGAQTGPQFESFDAFRRS